MTTNNMSTKNVSIKNPTGTKSHVKLCCFAVTESDDDESPESPESPESFVYTPGFNASTKLCTDCRINQAHHIRKLNINKVPREYLLAPDNINSFILTNTYKIDFNDRENFLNLPREHRLTKYDYYLCNKCYNHRSTSQDQVWNYWSDI